MRLVFSAPLVLIAACGTGHSTAPVADVSVAGASTSTSTGPLQGSVESPLRVEISSGCPESVASETNFNSIPPDWIANPDAAGLDETFVPGVPTSALVCRYSALTTAGSSTGTTTGVTGGALFTKTTLDASAAQALATLAAAIPAADPKAGHGCMFGLQSRFYTAIVFAVPGRSDIDLWLNDWMACPGLGNGSRDSELGPELAGFIAQLDIDAPRPPTG